MIRLSDIKINKEEKIKFELSYLKPMNSINDGFSSNELVIIGARPSRGKTSLVINIAKDFIAKCRKDNLKILFITLEMDIVSIAKRFKSSNDDAYYNNSNVFITNDFNDINNINGFDVVIIDYYGLIKMKKVEITSFLKARNKLIFCLCQLNRVGEEKEPTMAMLRGNGTIEQDADQIWFLYDDKLKIAKNRNGRIGKLNIVWDFKTNTCFLEE